MHAICFERVPVQVRPKRLACHTPDALRILFHRQRSGGAFQVHDDALGVWITQAERNASIARDSWGLDRRRLLSKAQTDCKNRKEKFVHGYGQLISKLGAAMIYDDER